MRGTRYDEQTRSESSPGRNRWISHHSRRRLEAVARPDKVAELSAVLSEHERQMVRPSWPSLIEAPIPVDRPLGVPARPDDEYVTWAN